MSDGLVKVRRALLSVTDKAGLAQFAQCLFDLGVELVSTGGTAKALKAGGLSVRDVSDFTGFPEMLEGRVKTLHPNVHGGLLYKRGNPLHEGTVAQHGIQGIDLLAVNLYRFEETVAKPGCTFEDAVENIDIGGPAMLRSAAKNHVSVTVVCNPVDYLPLMEEMWANKGCTTLDTRRALASIAFHHTAAYDRAIAEYFDRVLGAGV